MSKEVVLNDWLRAGKYVNGDRSYLGRRRETVQEAILDFANTGIGFPKDPDYKNQDHYFVANIIEAFTHELHSIAIPYGGPSSPPERIRVPLVWFIGDLADATESYTNYHHERGAGRRYDDNFSFLIKILRPEWPCIITRCGLRGTFKAPPNTSSYSYRKEIHGLSPWEKALKKEELDFFRNCGQMKHVKIREKLGRLLFLDPEIDFIHHLHYHKPYIEALALDSNAAEALTDAWQDLDDRYERKDHSYFDLLLDYAYSELGDAVDGSLIDRMAWDQADNTLQQALQNQPYEETPGFPIIRNKKYCKGLLELLKAYWGKVSKERLEELGQKLWRSTW